MSRIKPLGLLLLTSFIVGSATAQRFGEAVAVSGTQILIGDGTNPAVPGQVYVFSSNDNGGWDDVAHLSASDARMPVPGRTPEQNRVNRFGAVLSASGDLLVVGAPGAQAAYLYRSREEGHWVEVARLDGEGDNFGSTVATDGARVVVASPGTASETGAVFVFERTTSGGANDGADASRELWTLTSRLAPAELSVGDSYGAAVATRAGTVVVGAPGADEDAGAVYWHAPDSTGHGWTHGRLTSRVAMAGSRLGESVAFVGSAGQRFAAGMPGFADRSGAVVVFENRPSGWTTAERLSPFTAARAEGFGTSVAVAGDQLWVGAPGYGGRFGSGVVYTFTVTSGMPDDVAAAVADHLGRAGTDMQTAGLGRTSASAILDVRGMQARTTLGATIAANDQIAVVGAPGFDNRAGAGVAFSYSDGQWQQGPNLINEPFSYASIQGDLVSCDEDLAGDFPCRGVDMTSFLSVADLGADRGIRLNDLWGWRDSQTGKEYAIVGLSNQASFVDVTDAYNPIYLGKLPMPESANMSVWRDMKVYRDHAYIVSDGAGDHGMQVFDLRQLRGINTPQVFESTAHYRGIHSAHNIVINEQTGFAYAVGSSSGGETCGGGLHMIDIREPAQPQFAGCFSDGTTGRRGTGYSHDAQCVVYAGPDPDYRDREICIGSNETAISIADVTDKENPKSIAIASYPNVQYTHQGWLTDDQRYFYVNDELDENAGLVDGTRTLIFDLADLDDPLLVGAHVATTTETDHNLYVDGNYMYQSNTGAGLRILDISDPENPVETAYFDTSPVGGRGGSWSNYPYFGNGKIVVTAGHYGLFLLKKADYSF